MYTASAVITLLVLLFLPWLVSPLFRVSKQQDVGYVKEIQLLGLFWFTIGSMSNRLNKLETDKAKTSAKLKKLTVDIEKERKLLETEVRVIDDKYRNFLYDWNGKRHWRWLLRKVPVPSYAFVEPVKKQRTEQKLKDQRTTVFSLKNMPLPPEAVAQHKAYGKIVWAWDNNQFQNNQNQQNRRKNKGGNQQNNQQQNNN